MLAVGQLALVALDLAERQRMRPAAASKGRLRRRSVVFLGGVILVYGALQFGGLALVPNAAELLEFAQYGIGNLVVAADNGNEVTATFVILAGIGGFYFTGLCDYLFHRFASHSRLLWFSHENHHLTTDISAYMPGLCVRPFAVIAVFPTTAMAIFSVQLMLALVGRQGWDMMPVLSAVVLVHAAVLGITHSAFMRRQWWLHGLLKPLGVTTPQEHWLHHSADLECNYGNFTTLWDRVFGTYIDPQSIRFQQHRAGLDYDQDFLGTLTLGTVKLSETLRRRFQLAEFCYLTQPVKGSSA